MIKVAEYKWKWCNDSYEWESLWGKLAQENWNFYPKICKILLDCCASSYFPQWSSPAFPHLYWSHTFPLLLCLFLLPLLYSPLPAPSHPPFLNSSSKHLPLFTHLTPFPCSSTWSLPHSFIAPCPLLLIVLSWILLPPIYPCSFPPYFPCSLLYLSPIFNCS